MSETIFMIVLIGIMLIVIGVFAAFKIKKQLELRKKYPGFPKGYFMNQGVGIGIAIGAGIGAAISNLAIGIAVGVAIGLAIGSNLEKKNKDKVRPITEEEKKLKMQSIWFTAGVLAVGVVVYFVTYYIKN